MTPTPPETGTGKDGGDKATPRPWSLCGCDCCGIGAKDHPIADITKGDWGDFYPSVRLVKLDDRHEPVAEAFTDGLAYGNVPLEVAKANALLIVEAVNQFDSLKRKEAALARLVEAASQRVGKSHNDTCGTALNFANDCSCGHDELEAALSESKTLMGEKENDR